MEFKKLKLEDIQNNRCELYKQDIEYDEILHSFLVKMAKRGHEEVGFSIEAELIRFLAKKGIEPKEIFCQDNSRYINGEFYKDTMIVLYLPKFDIIKIIQLKQGSERNFEGGFYDNLLSLDDNSYLRSENLTQNKTRVAEKIKNVKALTDKYNSKLEELIKLRNDLENFKF